MANENPEEHRDEASDRYYEMYSHLREELNIRMQMHNKQRIRGLTAIAAIIGYALAAQSPSVIAVTPVILGLIYLDQIRIIRLVSAAARHSVEIEHKISNCEDIFVWEKKYGGYYGGWKSEKKWVSFFSPTNIIGVLFIISYLTLAIISVEFWNDKDIVLITVTQEHLTIFYTIFSLLLLIASLSVYMHYKELEKDLPRNQWSCLVKREK
ncbi:hypothetical protein EGH22_16670 [Halomicroarcula sp. F28]|uniref:hypothetical protein n=1 Tax=Haloarcula salinisoli TaxID=2487746 RepID=UPI001C730A35|nr:hypothetical protein [Halomicroarcula salinisoli]MBX0287968.1 hypothetical protein [Halomicroarcula salinisoli]